MLTDSVKISSDGNEPNLHRCWGRTQTLRRCGRYGQWRLFCADHRWQWVVALSFALFTVGGALASYYSAFSPPTESRQIIRAEEPIKASQRLLYELDSEITNLNLVLDLTEKLKAKDFLDEAFLVRIRSLDQPKNTNFETLLEMASAWGPDGKYRWGFMFESFFMEDRVKFVSSRGLMGSESELGAIPLPLSVSNSPRKPFKKIRDLDQCLIEVFAPSRFARYVSQIRLIANSGFQFTKHATVYSRVVHDSDWEDTDYALGNNFSSNWKRKSDEKYSWLRSRSLNRDLQVDLLKSSLVENGKTMPESFRIQY
jgi:hypothetical protein